MGFEKFRLGQAETDLQVLQRDSGISGAIEIITEQASSSAAAAATTLNRASIASALPISIQNPISAVTQCIRKLTSLSDLNAIASSLNPKPTTPGNVSGAQVAVTDAIADMVSYSTDPAAELATLKGELANTKCPVPP